MALACGARSASTKFCAKAETSTPDPADSEVISFCALALLAAAIDAAELDSALDVDELTAVVAISYFLDSLVNSDRTKQTWAT